MAILILDEDDENKEIEFELEFQSTLSIQQRIKMLEEKRKLFLKQMIDNGHRKPFEIIKRK